MDETNMKDPYDQAIADAEAALADLKAKREEARKPKLPEEPNGWGAVIKQPGRVPAYRYGRADWRYTTITGSYTWEELMNVGGTKFDILYDD